MLWSVGQKRILFFVEVFVRYFVYRAVILGFCIVKNARCSFFPYYDIVWSGILQ